MNIPYETKTKWAFRALLYSSILFPIASAYSGIEFHLGAENEGGIIRMYGYGFLKPTLNEMAIYVVFVAIVAIAFETIIWRLERQW